ncbi:site-specific integrase [Halarchaeum nitratireducens]|uniref:Uncharacterized protein n=1 Tax=Halarchaeum nitratireducens TaxID=489913 RepID=A0A830GFA6_9EURY|nr:tyrosine-type recombinase/integrase [Halarchaeum nitratireducens]GGN26453.1 hypothetical protein GCM10009021_31020 [Halarchaeum nitratireducens]
MSDLQPLSPEEAWRLYKDGRRDELSKETLDGQKYRIRAFIAWCEEEGIENLNDLDGRGLYAYRVWRREGNYGADDDEEPEELRTVTLKGNLATLRAFLRFCGNINAVSEELFEQVPLSAVSRGEDVSKTTLDPERAHAILDYLEKYHYTTRTHVVVLLLWHTGCRTAALRALDLEDLDLDASRPNADGLAVHFVHRPAEGTPLKNDEKGERWNTISEFVAAVLQGYIDGHRVPKTDEYDRAPLVTTEHGRITRPRCGTHSTGSHGPAGEGRGEPIGGGARSDPRFPGSRHDRVPPGTRRRRRQARQSPRAHGRAR